MLEPQGEPPREHQAALRAVVVAVKAAEGILRHADGSLRDHILVCIMHSCQTLCQTVRLSDYVSGNSSFPALEL